MDTNRPTQRHVIFKMPKFKDKERILKTARKKQRVTYKEVPIRPSADFSKKKLQDSQASLLKGSAVDLGFMQAHSLWAPAPGQQLKGHHWHTGRN